MRTWTVRIVGLALVILGVLVGISVVALVLATIDDASSSKRGRW